MNLFDSSFLCLDIGTTCVRGIAHRVRNGRIDTQIIHSIEDTDTVYALKCVVDELEQKIGHHFDSAYITGNFGPAEFLISQQTSVWSTPRRITPSDIRAQISHIPIPEKMFPMHIIPVQYDILGTKILQSPLGQSDRQLTTFFSAIFYNHDRLERIQSILRSAHIQASGFYDPHFLQSSVLRTNTKRMMFIDIGAEFTTASIWTARGPMWFYRIAHGGTAITENIVRDLSISSTDADRIKRQVSSIISSDMDRFTPADTAYAFSRADVNDIIIPHILDIITQIKNNGYKAIEKYKPTRIILTGGGAEISNISTMFENAFAIPVENKRSTETILSLSKYIWGLEKPRIDAYLARHKRWVNRIQKIQSIFKRHSRPRQVFIPIMPSTLCFNMHNPETYSLFNSGGISMIHIDIMDGLYVDRIAGNTNDIKYIRERTRAHLHVHLMTESPDIIASEAIKNGADTIIVSTGTSGLRRALHIIHSAGKRAGVALNPNSDVSLIAGILSELDEVMIMTVTPGASGQAFLPDCVKKIYELNELKKNKGLKFAISVDGGITDKTAPLCWKAGANFLVSGSYLAKSSDFPLAVQSLLPKNK